MNPDEVIMFGPTKREDAILEWFELTSHMAKESVMEAILTPLDAFVFIIAVSFEAGRVFEEQNPDELESGNRFQHAATWVEENASFASEQFESSLDMAHENSHTELGELLGYLIDCSFEAGRMFEVQNPDHAKGVNAYAKIERIASF